MDIRRLKPDTRAASWMGVSVFLMSWVPLVVALVGTTVGPFVFQFWFHLIISIVWFVYLMLTCPDLIRRRDVWTWIVRRLPTRDGVPAMLNGFIWALFVWATLFLDTALVTVITGGWLILFVAYQKRHDTRSRYRTMVVQDWLLIATAMAGIALVTLSQSGGITTEGGGWKLLWGLLLAASTAVCLSWISFRFKLGTALYHSICKGTTELPDDPKDELGCILAVSIVTNVAGILGSLIVGLTFFPGLTGPGIYLGGFASIAVIWVIVTGIVSSFGNIAFRYANPQTKHLGVNVIQYLRPVLSLIWLGSFATVTVYRTDFLWIGATAVIAVNALINFRSEERADVRWLILSLLGFGFIVYMRDEWFTHIPEYGWFSVFGNYYGLLGAGATVFVLILLFRTSRLNAHMINEEQQTYALYRKLVGLQADEENRATMLKSVRTINTTNDVTRLTEAYEYVSHQIGIAGLDRSETARLQASLDTLVNSKQRGRNMAELVVIVISALVVAGMAVFARTEAAAWPALLNDVVSMLLASVVVFMTIHLFGQRSERDDPLITETGSVLFRDTARTVEQSPKIERVLSVVIGLAIIGIYVFLMTIKWLPV